MNLGWSPRYGRHLATAWLASAFLAALLALPLAAAGLPPTGATLVLGSDGTLAASLTATVPNGSALRYAMDGNFSPFLDALPINNSSRASLENQIAQLERSPIFGGLFGDHDGVVSATDITLFQSLLVQESSFLPSGTFLGSSNFGVRLDGAGPTTARLSSVAFSEAAGPVASTAPIGFGIGLSFAFALSGTAHVLAIASGSTGLPSQVPTLGPTLDLTFTTPAGMSVTSTAGFSSTSTSNDLWGWGPSSVHGTYAPVNAGTVTIRFANAFPTGYVVIGVVAAAAAAGAGVLFYRRRRGRAATPSMPTEPVGPSGSG